MGRVSFALLKAFDDKYNRMEEYLSSEGVYWEKSDKWYLEEECFKESGIHPGNCRKGLLADFSGYQSQNLKTEMKYFLLYSMKNGQLSVRNIWSHYRKGIREMGYLLTEKYPADCFIGLDNVDRELIGVQMGSEMKRLYLVLKYDVVSFITDYYNARDEME